MSLCLHRSLLVYRHDKLILKSSGTRQRTTSSASLITVLLSLALYILSLYSFEWASSPPPLLWSLSRLQMQTQEVQVTRETSHFNFRPLPCEICDFNCFVFNCLSNKRWNFCCCWLVMSFPTVYVYLPIFLYCTMSSFNYTACVVRELLHFVPLSFCTVPLLVTLERRTSSVSRLR